VGGDIKKLGADEFSYDHTPLDALASSLRLFADVRACLDLVVAPLILWRSSIDHVVPMVSKEVVLRNVSSHDITDSVLTNSYHVATLDND
ncbi:MAG TPA: esterase, partial [Propionibacteriaceae bacterium]|nr:esterase [Propionibacteriaceae bacterium]